MSRFRDGFTSTGAAAGLTALFFVLGGTAVASNVVTSSDIKNHSILAVDLAPGSVVGAAVRNGFAGRPRPR